MKNVFIHIGLGKTGTSSIQKLLIENCELLSTQGILVPKTGMKYGKAHHDLAVLGDEKMSHKTLDAFKLLIAEIEHSNAQKNNNK